MALLKSYEYSSFGWWKFNIQTSAFIAQRIEAIAHVVGWFLFEGFEMSYFYYTYDLGVYDWDNWIYSVIAHRIRKYTWLKIDIGQYVVFKRNFIKEYKVESVENVWQMKNYIFYILLVDRHFKNVSK